MITLRESLRTVPELLKRGKILINLETLNHSFKIALANGLTRGDVKILKYSEEINAAEKSAILKVYLEHNNKMEFKQRKIKCD